MNYNKALRCSGALLLLACTLVGAIDGRTTASMSTERVDWPFYHGTLNNQRYSELDDIKRETVNRLQVSWAFQTGVVLPHTAFQCTPVVSDGLMYVTSPLCEVFALNAETGHVVWHYDPKVIRAPYQETKNRGVVVAYGKVYLATQDCRLIALDARTGEPVQSFGERGAVRIIDFKQGYSETSPPTICDSKIMIGVACGEFPTRGFVTAYDATSGKLLWRWHTIPAPGEPGGDTWPNNGSYKTGGGSTWMPAAIDSERGLVIFGVGNPNPDFDGRNRAGDNLYTCSVVALDINSGKLRWYFQMIKHDLWDYDQAASPLLFDVVRDGRKIPAVGAATKTGWFYVLDRETGKSLLPTREVTVPQDRHQRTARTQPFLDVPPFVEHRNIFTPPTPKGVLIAPGTYGGSEWSPLAYSPQTNLVYISAIEHPQIFQYYLRRPSLRRDGAFAAERWGGENNDPPGLVTTGAFVAIDVNTGLEKWRTPTQPSPIGGSLATAGGLVFTGEATGYFIALDAQTGKRLWRFNCGSGVGAAPMTYRAGGRQYIAVAAGGGSPPFVDPVKRIPRPGCTIFVFALSDHSRPIDIIEQSGNDHDGA